jgi:hypothetical protein
MVFDRLQELRRIQRVMQCELGDCLVSGCMLENSGGAGWS